MSTLNEYISAVKTQRDNLAANLNTMGVEANNSETLNTLVPKVLDIKSEETGENVFDDIVRFYDYNGDLLYEYTLDEIQALVEMPAPPNHDYLVFQEWNCSLDALKSLTTGADVGAVYTTVDGHNKYVINVPDTNFQFVFQLATQTDGNSNYSVYINWGDNSNEDKKEVASGVTSNSYVFSHTYASSGKYVISVYGNFSNNFMVGILFYSNSGYGLNSIYNIMCEAYLCNEYFSLNTSDLLVEYLCMSKEYISLFQSGSLGIPSTLSFFVFPSTYNRISIETGYSYYKMKMPPILPLGIQDLPERWLNKFVDILRIPQGIVAPDYYVTVSCNHAFLPSSLYQNGGYIKIDSLISKTFELLDGEVEGAPYVYVKNISDSFQGISYSMPFSIKFKDGIEEIHGQFAPSKIISVPASCIKMDNADFESRALEKIYSYPRVPPTISTELDMGTGAIPTFYILPSGYHPIKIYVPSGCAASYQASDWGSIPMAEFIEME